MNILVLRTKGALLKELLSQKDWRIPTEKPCPRFWSKTLYFISDCTSHIHHYFLIYSLRPIKLFNFSELVGLKFIGKLDIKDFNTSLTQDYSSARKIRR